MNTIREALKEKQLKQNDLIHGLIAKGYKISPSELSQMLSETINSPKAQKVRRECEEIIRNYQ